jgi:hypothetical protein
MGRLWKRRRLIVLASMALGCALTAPTRQQPAAVLASPWATRLFLPFAALGVPESPLEIQTLVDPNVSCLAVDAHYAYLCLGRRIGVVDVSEPETPTQVADTPWLPARATSLLLSGDVLYAGLANGDLQVLETAGGHPPRPIAMLTFPAAISALAVSGHFLIVDTDKQLVVVNVARPDRPEAVVWQALPGEIKGLVADGEYVYASVGNGLYVLRLGHLPDLPLVSVLSVCASECGAPVLASGRLLVPDADHVHILDVTQSALPTEVRNVAFTSSVTAVAAGGVYAYVAVVGSPLGDPGVYLLHLDALPEGSPTPEDWVPGVFRWLVLGHGDHLYGSGQGQLLTVFDAAAPQRPVERGGIRGGGDVWLVTTAGQHVVTLENHCGPSDMTVDCMVTRDPHTGSPESVESFVYPRYFGGVFHPPFAYQAESGFVWPGELTAGLWMVGLSPDHSPRCNGVGVDYSLWPYGDITVRLGGDILAVTANQKAQLFVPDEPNCPKEGAVLNDLVTLTLHGGYAYTLTTNGYIGVWSVREGNWGGISSIQLRATPASDVPVLAATDGRLYVIDQGDLVTIDVSEPYLPRQIGRAPMPGSPLFDLFPAGDLLLGHRHGETADALVALDMRDPNHPTELSDLPAFGGGATITSGDKVAYVNVPDVGVLRLTLAGGPLP